MDTISQDPIGENAYLTDPQERKWSMWAHASALLGILIPLTNFVGPLLIWLAKKNALPLATEQAREALNFNLTVVLVAVVGILLLWFGIGWLVLIPLGITWISLTIVAIVATGSGRPYRYPFTLRLV